MDKKKILICSELHSLSTGYSNYSKELLYGLCEHGAASDKYEVAEYATYLECDEPKSLNVPWKIYPSAPAKNSPERKQFDSDPANVFGKYYFENVCLDFKPNYVIDFRDYWMMDFESYSPFRPYFNWLIMPACDAEPQNEQWLYTYSQADGCFSYSDWGADLLKKSSSGKINVLGSASPCAPKEYVPLNIQKCKQHMRIDDDVYIIGTVMRNQRRKLYPELFEGFRKFLDESGRNDIYLYCHTSYPDYGWDLPYLLKYYGITNRTLFTYKCKSNKCGHFGASFYSDAATICPACNELTFCMPNVKEGLSHNEMAVIYNSMDLYVQYANSEGFGMPAVEAASCGVPLTVVNYSAMCDFVKKLNAMPIEAASLYTELETGCKRAVPNTNNLVDNFKKFFSLPKAMQMIKRNSIRDAFTKNYNYKNTVKKWVDAIDSIDNAKSWDSPSRFKYPNLNIPNNLDNNEFVKWILINVLGEPDKIGTYLESRLVRDITYGYVIGGQPGNYFNEDSDKFARTPYQQFSREDAIKYMVFLANKRNHWESIRTGNK